MMNEDKRMKLYNLNRTARNLRKKIASSLEQTREGEFDKASRILEETQAEFDALKKESENILDDGYVASMGFTEIFQDAVCQANRLYARNCPAIKFHVYN